MALQFASAPTKDQGANKGKGKGKKGKKGQDARMLLEAVTRREQSLALFHLVGKVLYNKRERHTCFMYCKPVWLTGLCATRERRCTCSFE